MTNTTATIDKVNETRNAFFAAFAASQAVLKLRNQLTVKLQNNGIDARDARRSSRTQFATEIFNTSNNENEAAEAYMMALAAHAESCGETETAEIIRTGNYTKMRSWCNNEAKKFFAS